MSIRLKWAAVCVHCRAPIGGEVPFPIPIPTAFHEPCAACGQPLVIILLDEGAMVAVPRNWRPYGSQQM